MDVYTTEYYDTIAVYCFKSGGAWYQHAAVQFVNFKNGVPMHEGFGIVLQHVTVQEIAELYS